MVPMGDAGCGKREGIHSEHEVGAVVCSIFHGVAGATTFVRMSCLCNVRRCGAL